MTTRSKCGITKLVAVFSPWTAISIMFALYSSTMNCLGLFQPLTIKRFVFGTGNPELVLPSWQVITTMSCALSSIPRPTWLSLLPWIKLSVYGISLVSLLFFLAVEKKKYWTYTHTHTYIRFAQKVSSSQCHDNGWYGKTWTWWWYVWYNWCHGQVCIRGSWSWCELGFFPSHSSIDHLCWWWSSSQALENEW